MLFKCPTPKLTPLQSRFLASFLTLVLLGIVYWSLSNPHFAYAAELAVDGSGQSRGGEDHNWHRIPQLELEEDGMSADASMVVERAPAPSTINGNNSPNVFNLAAGDTAIWIYPNTLRTAPHAATGPGFPTDPIEQQRELIGHGDLRRRDGLEERQSNGSIPIFISINTCLQPTWNGTGAQTAAPPQLTLYVATEESNKSPGPNADGSSQIAVVLQEGFANVTVNATGTWYMSVGAPALPDGFDGPWNYELAVSIDDYYHASDPIDPFMFLVDTDNESALLVTDNLTQTDPGSPIYQEWLSLDIPFVMFAANVNHTAIMGIQSSFCGWSMSRQVAANQADPVGINTNVQMGMITRGLGNKLKEQFYVTELNRTSNYTGVLAIDGNSTKSGSGVVGGGGKVWAPVNWTTKTDGNCALLFNLSFCDEVAYAVPSNPSKFNITGLQQMFDNYTSTNYQFFNYSLQQIPCTTTSDAQYSLAQDCDECAAAYKEWLCAVSIPRCADFSDPSSFLQVRNVGQQFLNNTMLSDDYLNTPYVPMSGAPTLPGSPWDRQTLITSLATNSSRNPTIIDQTIMPGPYKEVLPCEDLCWGLVQSCPASLGFGCPFPGRGLEVGYGKRSTNGTLTCSYLGAVYDTNGVGGSMVPAGRVLALAALVGWALIVL